MSPVSLFISLLVQGLTLFSSNGVLLYIASHHFGHLRFEAICL